MHIGLTSTLSGHRGYIDFQVSYVTNSVVICVLGELCLDTSSK